MALEAKLYLVTHIGAILNYICDALEFVKDSHTRWN
jgi:hypothetical protein